MYVGGGWGQGAGGELFHLCFEGVDDRLQLGCFVRHEPYHCLGSSCTAQLIDHTEQVLELRAGEHLRRGCGEANMDTHAVEGFLM